MNESDLSLLTLACAWPVSVAAPLVVVAVHYRGLSEEQRARTWPDATLGVATLLIGPLLLPFHFAMAWHVGETPLKRWGYSVVGFGLGLIWLVAVLAVLEGLAYAVEGLASGYS